MSNSDTVRLLRECDAGTKMAVSSIDELLDRTDDVQLKALLSDNKNQHSRLGNELHGLLNRYDADDKEPTPMAKGMSWMKTNFKMGVENSDATIADLITDGCNMGVKSLNKYLNKYATADAESKGICNRLIALEEQLTGDLREYL